MFTAKRQNRYLRILLGTLLLCSSNIHAQWIEASGSAEIRRSGKAEARSQAVQNAVKDALLFAGASVSSIAEVSDGLLTQDHLKVSSHGSIRQLELVDELYQSGLVTVTIRADIIPGEQKQCLSGEFLKSVAITQLRLVNREQAKIGRIYDLGKAFSERLYQQMHSERNKVLARPWYLQKLDSQTSFEQYYGSNFGLIDTIGDDSESQFVMLGQITDLSFGEQTSSDLAFWRPTAAERFFALDVTLYDTSTKSLVYREQFETVADWEGDRRRNVDVNGRRFWETDYGHAVDNLLGRVKIALEEVIYCQPLLGKIVKIGDNQLQFNLGSENGIKKGQVFSIIHQSHFITQSGKHLPHFVISPYKVKVVDVYTRTAVAQAIGEELLGNIQTTDQVILQEVDEPTLDELD